MSRLAAPFLSLLALAAFAAGAATLQAQVKDASGKPLADAVVYAIAGATYESKPSKAPVAVEQVDREFVPYVTVIQVGTTVTFPNRDPILHHVYSFSPAKSFEIKLYTGKSPMEVVFDKPGVVTLGCNIHDWMIGYIAVVPTPWFAKTDAAGTAILRDLPAGAYDIHAWHPQQRGSLGPARVTFDAPASTHTAAFTIDAPPRKPKYKPPLDRLKY
jgi:plastocyanin